MDIESQLKQAMRCFAASVCIVSAQRGDQRQAMTASSVTSVSMQPASMLFCVNQSAGLHHWLHVEQTVCINLLTRDQTDISNVCSTEQCDRFEDTHWQDFNGIPYLDNAQANVFCKIQQVHQYGTHSIVIADVTQALCTEPVRPLLYVNGQYTSVTVD